jgi:hypothetical protein
MAHAPTPGVSARNDAATSAKRIVVVRMVRTDDTYRIAAANLPLEQRPVVLKQVGVSYDTILRSEDGMLSTAVFVWLSRRLNGERSLSWAQFQRSWPEDLEEGDIELWAEDLQGRKLGDDGEVIVDEDTAVDVAVDGWGAPVDPVEPAEVNDPQS